MAQDYTLTYFRVSDFKDNNGNTWCDAAFDGISEPVKWVVKDPTTVVKGQQYYGQIVEAISKAGKPYLRFKREQRLEASTGNSPQTFSKNSDAIRAQWAIGQAVQLAIADNLTDIVTIEATAKTLFAMVERVKAGTTTASAVNDPGKTYSGTSDKISDAEFASLSSHPDMGEPDFSDIPY
jgi:formylmethanofuran dehydrogenase subunit A